MNNVFAFGDWLTAELDKRGWTQADLVRESGLSRAQVSMVVNGGRKPGKHFCRSVARALSLPEEAVFRRAGMLPPSQAYDEKAETVKKLMAELDEWDKDEVIDFMKLKIARKQRLAKVNPLLARIREIDADPSISTAEAAKQIADLMSDLFQAEGHTLR